jgi:membrane protease YdiL (CAAX protease family)
VQAVESSAESHQTRLVSQREPGSVFVFFALTFTVAWIFWALSLRLAEPAADIVFLLGVFAPGLVALALTVRRDGRAGAGALLNRIACWNVPGKWYLFAIFYMPAIKIVAATIHRGLTGAWPRFGTESIVLMFAALLVSTWVQAGEEVGWRGYALPRMSDRIGLGPATIVLGIAWAAWHLPLFFYFNGDTRGQSFPLYLTEVVAMSVAMGWLFWKTNGSLLLVMLLHAANNILKDIVPSAEPHATNPFTLNASTVGWITAALLWTAEIIMLLDMRRQNAQLRHESHSTP